MDFDYKNEIIVDKSRFIALAKIKFSNVDNIEVIIKELKKEYKKAKHICYAYIINYNNILKKKYFDDKEPSGTAGLPILSTIENMKQENILIVVIRYFGGKKLGASKLLRTYKKSTKEVIKIFLEKDNKDE